MRYKKRDEKGQEHGGQKASCERREEWKIEMPVPIFLLLDSEFSSFVEP